MKDILPMRKLRLPFLSTRKSTLPPLMSLMALVTSMVTVPVFGFGTTLPH